MLDLKKVNEEKTYKPWTKAELPEKILVIRLQAFGDSFATLPYIQYLRNNLPPNTRIDFLTKRIYDSIPVNIELFNHVYSLNGGYSTKKQYAWLSKHLYKLVTANYDVVLDLQNNGISNFIRKMIRPECYVTFDKYSPIHACKRYINTINQAGFIRVKEAYDFKIKTPLVGKEILKKHGWDENEKLILLNPAGAFVNRNWPIENYAALAKLLLNTYNDKIKFLVLGTSKIASKSVHLKQELGRHLISLVDVTNQIEAFAIIKETTLSITEDGALMHMSYLSNIKTIGVLGSTRSDWCDPQLPHTFFFTSNDLECGNCMLETCKFATNHCVTRISPEQVFERSVYFLNH